MSDCQYLKYLAMWEYSLAWRLALNFIRKAVTIFDKETTTVSMLHQASVCVNTAVVVSNMRPNSENCKWGNTNSYW